VTHTELAIARFLEAVGPEAVRVETLARDSGARYCGCGRRISANAASCLECAEKAK